MRIKISIWFVNEIHPRINSMINGAIFISASTAIRILLQIEYLNLAEVMKYFCSLNFHQHSNFKDDGISF